MPDPIMNPADQTISESRAWAESIDLALGQSGIKQRGSEEKIQRSQKRRESILTSLEKFHEDGGFDLISYEISVQEEFENRALTNDETEKIIRGHLFENIALQLLAEQGEPVHPEASQKIAHIVRFPHKFIDEFENLAKKRGLLDEKVMSKIHEARSKLSKTPRNNDAMAIDFVANSSGFVEARIVGSYEMKNHQLRLESSAEAVVHQLRDAAEDTRKVLETLTESGIYTAYTVLNEDINLPNHITIAEPQEFQQVIVQPQGMFEAKEGSSSEELRSTYEKNVNTIESGLREGPDYKFVYVGISKSELHKIYDVAVSDIKKHISIGSKASRNQPA